MDEKDDAAKDDTTQDSPPNPAPDSSEQEAAVQDSEQQPQPDPDSKGAQKPNSLKAICSDPVSLCKIGAIAAVVILAWLLILTLCASSKGYGNKTVVNADKALIIVVSNNATVCVLNGDSASKEPRRTLKDRRPSYAEEQNAPVSHDVYRSYSEGYVVEQRSVYQQPAQFGWLPRGRSRVGYLGTRTDPTPRSSLLPAAPQGQFYEGPEQDYLTWLMTQEGVYGFEPESAPQRVMTGPSVGLSFGN